MCHMSSQCKNCQARRGRCALQRGITVPSSFLEEQRKCIWVLWMQQGDRPPLKFEFTNPKVTDILKKRRRREVWPGLGNGLTAYLIFAFVSAAVAAVLDVTAVPQDDISFLVQWKRGAPSGLTGYVVEWKPLLADNSHIQFETADKNQSGLIITGMFYIML